jgi:hypothetical protein
MCFVVRQQRQQQQLTQLCVVCKNSKEVKKCEFQRFAKEGLGQGRHIWTGKVLWIARVFDKKCKVDVWGRKLVT